jgi:hypothetical protein
MTLNDEQNKIIGKFLWNKNMITIERTASNNSLFSIDSHALSNSYQSI